MHVLDITGFFCAATKPFLVTFLVGPNAKASVGMARRPQMEPFAGSNPNFTPLNDHVAAEAFDKLLELLPLGTVSGVVARYYTRHAAAVKAAATGGLASQLAGEISPDERVKLAELLGQLPVEGNDGVDVEGEARTARHALVAYWLDVVSDAQRRLTRDGVLQLNLALLPPEPPVGDPKHRGWVDWEKRRFRSEQSVLSSVALDEGDPTGLTIAFAGNVARKVAKEGRIAVPRNNVLVGGGRNLFVLRPM